MTSAKIICDSITNNGARLTTFEVVFHRYLLAEFNTHRDFSRNAASSRAIPVAKQLERIYVDPALPMIYGRNQRGMSSHDELTLQEKFECEHIILDMMTYCMVKVRRLNEIGLHKQWANRYLEPWMWVTDIVTATNYANFFAQRTHPDAHPDFKVLADLMYDAYQSHTPNNVVPGSWHRPYIERDDVIAVAQRWSEGENGFNDMLNAMSVARCAGVSYLNHNGTNRTIDGDLAIYEKLLAGGFNGHWSPFEHVAQAATNLVQSGNFTGWVQFRKMFPQEYVREFVKDSDTERKEGVVS